MENNESDDDVLIIEDDLSPFTPIQNHTTLIGNVSNSNENQKNNEIVINIESSDDEIDSNTNIQKSKVSTIKPKILITKQKNSETKHLNCKQPSKNIIRKTIKPRRNHTSESISNFETVSNITVNAIEDLDHNVPFKKYVIYKTLEKPSCSRDVQTIQFENYVSQIQRNIRTKIKPLAMTHKSVEKPSMSNGTPQIRVRSQKELSSFVDKSKSINISQVRNNLTSIEKPSSSKVFQQNSCVLPPEVPGKKKVQASTLKKSKNGSAPETITHASSETIKDKTKPAALYLCRHCNFQSRGKTSLCVHVKKFHLFAKHFFQCICCSFLSENCLTVQDHFMSQHTNLPNVILTWKSTYKCTHCDIASADELTVKKHIKTLIDDENYDLEPHGYKKCYGCSFKTNKWNKLKHNLCSECYQSGVFEQADKCFFCHKVITGEQLECVNRECENKFHLECVHTVSNFIDISEVNKVLYWYCTECNDHSILNKPKYCLETIEMDVNLVELSVKFGEDFYLKEVEKQKHMTEIMKQIKADKVKMQQEFAQIQSFVKEAKSDTINNKLAVTVCNIIDLNQASHMSQNRPFQKQ